MKNIVILLFLLVFHNCNSNELSSEINKIYNLNKEKDFSEFDNWTIFLREEEGATWLFDYTPNNKIEARYLIIQTDSLLVKRIFPLKDSVFHSLNVYASWQQYAEDAFSLNLYLNFRALKIDAISYQQDDSLYLLKKGGIILIHTKKPTDISTFKKFCNYKKIDSYWFYSVK